MQRALCALLILNKKIPMNPIRSIKKIALQYQLYFKYRDMLAKNKKLKNTESKRCFIIGTGPSVKDQDLLRLKDEDTFVVNSFWNHPQYKEINPKYYVMIDWDIFPVGDQKGNFVSDEVIQKQELLNSCSTKFFFHSFGKEFIEKNGLLQNNRIYYLMNHGVMDEKLKFNIDIEKVITYTKNVIVASIMIAAYMGFEEIYLLGCEHDYLAYPAQKYYEKFPHFFKNPYELSNKKSSSYYIMAVMPYEKHIYNSLILFRNYRLLKEKLSREKPNIKIYNATPNSYLDVFPMVKYEDIIL